MVRISQKGKIMKVAGIVKEQKKTKTVRIDVNKWGYAEIYRARRKMQELVSRGSTREELMAKIGWQFSVIRHLAYPLGVDVKGDEEE